MQIPEWRYPAVVVSVHCIVSSLDSFVPAYLRGQDIFLGSKMLDSLRELVYNHNAKLSDLVGDVVLSMHAELRGLAR